MIAKLSPRFHRESEADRQLRAIKSTRARPHYTQPGTLGEELQLERLGVLTAEERESIAAKEREHEEFLQRCHPAAVAYRAARGLND